jgi:hypothetical protein
MITERKMCLPPKQKTPEEFKDEITAIIKELLFSSLKAINEGTIPDCLYEHINSCLIVLSEEYHKKANTEFH